LQGLFLVSVKITITIIQLAIFGFVFYLLKVIFLTGNLSKQGCARVDFAILIKLDFVATITAKLYMKLKVESPKQKAKG